MPESTNNDTADLASFAAALPDHIEYAIRAARSLEGLPEKDRIENVVVLGMGHSGVAGDILLATAAPFMSVPVTVVRSYELPAFVGEGSLVFALSYSGETEEVIEAATDAAVQGARIVVVSQGGRLSELAGSWSAPVVRIPKDIPQSGAALGVLAIPAIVILEELGLFPGGRQWIDLAVEQLQRRRDELSGPDNIASKLADNLVGKYVFVQGGGAIGAAASERWKMQINVNAKQFAFSAVMPDLYHSEAAGFEALADKTAKDIAIVCLRHDDEHPQVVNRFSELTSYWESKVASIDHVHAEGDGSLAQLFDLIMIGDYLSLSLAATNNVDPAVYPSFETPSKG